MSRLRDRWKELQTALREKGRVLIAFSGGCDSAFLAATAQRALGSENILAVTAVSASLGQREKEEALRFAAAQNIPHQFLETNELNDPRYRQNPPNRCFYCKDELFARLVPLAKEGRFEIVDGLNWSDRDEIRPGVLAAEKWGVRHPLYDAGLSKRDVRVLSRWLKLSTWNKPAAPCLSSRVPHGSAITEKALREVEAAESFLKDEGFRVVRVRHWGGLARIEAPLARHPELSEAARWSRIERRFREIGFSSVALDERGFKSGRLNEIVPGTAAEIFSQKTAFPTEKSS